MPDQTPKPEKKKLTINKERLKRLTPEELNHVGGGLPLGLPDTYTCTCRGYGCCGVATL